MKRLTTIMAHSTWSDKTFLSKIEVLPPVSEHLVRSEGGVLYLFEANSEAHAQGIFCYLLYCLVRSKFVLCARVKLRERIKCKCA